MEDNRQSLIGRIAAAIETEGVQATREDGRTCRAVPFSRYMELCLYDERFGYYRSGQVRTGKQGDFYTSSAIGGIMGELLARFIHKTSAGCSTPPIVAEWGAGAGAMTCRMLETWGEQAPEWLGGIDYWAVDGHPLHLETTRRLMDQTIHGQASARSIAAMNSIEAASALARHAKDRPILILANELIDAMPVHRVAMRRGQLAELGVCLKDEPAANTERLQDGALLPEEARRFETAYMPLSSRALAESIEADGVPLHEGQQTEINLAAEQWLADMGRMIGSGMLVIIDYGHDAQEYRAAHRMNGTLLCYRQHMAHGDPYFALGGQDMTAHVNYTALKRAAVHAGWTVAYDASQLQFLMDQGIAGLLANHNDPDPFSETARRNRAIRQLLLSDSMSETFKVVILTRGSIRLERNRE